MNKQEENKRKEKILKLIEENNEIIKINSLVDEYIKAHNIELDKESKNRKNTDYLKYIGSGYSGHWEIVDR